MTLHQILRRGSLFAPLKAAERQVLEQALCVRRYPRGYRFTEQGKRADAMYLIIEGQITLQQHVEGSTQRSRHKTLRPGTAIGLVSMIDNGPATATSRARGTVTVASLPRDAFMLLVSTRAEIGRHFQQMVARQLDRQIHLSVRRTTSALSKHDGHAIRTSAEQH